MGPPQPGGGGGEDAIGAEGASPSVAATAVAFDTLARAGKPDAARANAPTRASCGGSGAAVLDAAPHAASPSPRLAPAAAPPRRGSAASAASASASDDDGSGDGDDDGYSSRGLEDGSGSDSEREAGASYASAFGGASSGDAEASRRMRPAFRVLDDEGIAARQAEAVAAVDAVLRCGAEAATLLLRHYRWQPARVHEEWFQARTGPCLLARLRTRRAAMPWRLRGVRALTQQGRAPLLAPRRSPPCAPPRGCRPPRRTAARRMTARRRCARAADARGARASSNAPGRALNAG